jgi:hypothetical protein
MQLKTYGLSGYLAPDGIFYECKFKEHQELAMKLKRKYKLSFLPEEYNDLAMRGEFIKFGTYPGTPKKGCSGCHVFKSFSHSLTKEQVFWLRNNLDRLTDMQHQELINFLDENEIEMLTLQIV